MNIAAEEINRAAELYVHRGICVYMQSAHGDLSDFVALMEAVEALCPVWPPRELDHDGVYLL